MGEVIMKSKLLKYRLYTVKAMAMYLDDSWSFRYMNRKVTLGSCNYPKKIIRLSRWYVLENDHEEISDTVLHEIAHALSFERYGKDGKGHGKLWKKVCREIGAVPKRRGDESKIIKEPDNFYEYVDTCCCGTTFRRHRIRRHSTYRCPNCHQNLFVEKKDIVVYRDGKKVA